MRKSFSKELQDALDNEPPRPAALQARIGWLVDDDSRKRKRIVMIVIEIIMVLKIVTENDSWLCFVCYESCGLFSRDLATVRS